MVIQGLMIMEFFRQRTTAMMPILLDLIQQTIHHLPRIGTFGLGLIALIVYLFWIRYRTYRRLVQHGFPTVYWNPKLWARRPTTDELISSSTITNILPRMQRLQGKHYGIYGTVYGWNTPVIHVAHPVPAAALLSSTQHRKRPAYDHFVPFCGQGVFTADGPAWRAQRKAVVHAVVRQRELPAEAAADALLEVLRAQFSCGGGGDNGGSDDTTQMTSPEFNIVPLIQRVTIGMMYKFLTGRELLDEDFDDDGDNDVQRRHPPHAARQPASSSFIASYLQAITNIRMVLLAQSRSIWFLLPRWMYRLCSHSLYPAEQAAMQPIRRLANQACTTCTAGSPLAVLQTLDIYRRHPATASHGTTTTSSNNSGTGPSPRILEEAITLLFAGQDTSAATLSWTLHLLSQHMDVQERLAEHLLKNEDDRYLEAVLKESMRLYPVAPFVVRHVGDTPLRIPGGNATIPAGTLACIWIYSLHRNPAVWKDRPNEFVPERWLLQQGAAPPTSAAYMPFCLGPRQCLGQPLAQTVLRTLLARVVRAFVLTPSARATTVDMQAGFTVLPRGGVPVRITPRRVPTT